MLSGHGDDSAAVLIYSRKSDADTVLSDFANELGREIQRSLAETQRQ